VVFTKVRHLIKLVSALHPRYSRAQYERVMEELYPVLLNLTAGETLRHRPEQDAEKPPIAWKSPSTCFTPVLRPSPERLERHRLCHPVLSKARLYVIDYIIDLAKRSRHRLMIRLSKAGLLTANNRRRSSA
jgi:RHH-type proline utilization regulon transcriptional repressor/proline dehydrogenase/delta 1-pyrroline-5-carboxylate dehydrogenase